MSSFELKSLAAGVVIFLANAATSLGQAPEDREVFNIRFQNITFRPPVFSSFNFQQPGFQPLVSGPIPFRGIQFRGFLSRYDLESARTNSPQVTGDRFFTYRGRAEPARRRGTPAVRTARFDRREPFGHSVRVSRREPPNARMPVRTARRRPFAAGGRDSANSRRIRTAGRDRFRR